jgi:glycyl-tRNA synthetase
MTSSSQRIGSIHAEHVFRGASFSVQVSQGLVAPTAAYFDKVFVMSEDDAVRQNRLALLRDIADLPKGIINFAQLPGF